MIWDLAKGALILVFCIGLGTAVIVWGAQWLWTRRSSYDPRFADAPDPVEKAYTEAGDTFGFVSRMPDGPLFAAEVESMVRRAAEGVDVYDGAPKEQT